MRLGQGWGIPGTIHEELRGRSQGKGCSGFLPQRPPEQGRREGGEGGQGDSRIHKLGSGVSGA